MLFFFSKIIGFIFKPLGIVFVLLFYLIFNKNRTKTKRLNFIILVLLSIFSLDAIVYPLFKAWEIENPKLKDIPIYEYGVVLTGGIINEKQLPEAIILNKESDRIWQALYLYKKNKIKKIIISGGDWLPMVENEIGYENDKAKAFLMFNGIPESDIIQEKKSVNTFQNAKYTQKILKNHSKKILLISSSFHLKRAKACFEKAGLRLDTFGTNPKGEKPTLNYINFFPTARAMADFELLVKEWVGMIAYKFMGYA